MTATHTHGDDLRTVHTLKVPSAGHDVLAQDCVQTQQACTLCWVMSPPMLARKYIEYSAWTFICSLSSLIKGLFGSYANNPSSVGGGRRKEVEMMADDVGQTKLAL